MFNIISLSYAYGHSVCVRPNGEILYKHRLMPVDKKKAIPEYARSVSFARAGGASLAVVEGGARDSALPSTLGNTDEFHPSSKLHSKQGRNGYGVIPEKPTAFTRRAKNSIRFSAAAIQNEFGKDACWFLTGTLPGSTPEAMKTFAEWSSWFVDRLNKWLLKHFSIEGKVYRISCWELQKRGALHLHMLIASRSPLDVESEFQRYWWHLLEEISQFTGVDLFARARGGTWRHSWDSTTKRGKPVRDIVAYAQKVEKSVSQYLSKYLSKDAGNPRKSKGFPPARWWSVSRASQALVAAQTITIPLPRCTADQLEVCRGFVQQSFVDAGLTWGESLYEYRLLDGSQHSIPLGFVAWDSYSEATARGKELAACLSEFLEPNWKEQSLQIQEHLVSIDYAVFLHEEMEREAAAWEVAGGGGSKYRSEMEISRLAASMGIIQDPVPRRWNSPILFAS